jgi:hypothetical protein
MSTTDGGLLPFCGDPISRRDHRRDHRAVRRSPYWGCPRPDAQLPVNRTKPDGVGRLKSPRRGESAGRPDQRGGFMEVICTLSRSVFRIARLRRAPLALLVAAVALASGVVALAAVVAPSNSKGLVAVGPVDPVTRRCSHASGSPSHCPRPQSARPARSSTLMGRTRSSPSSPARGRSCSPRTSRPERRALTTPLQSRGGPFLKWDTGAPEGYLGDPNVEHAVTGSPFSTNFVRIEGKDIGAPARRTCAPTRRTVFPPTASRAACSRCRAGFR